MGGPLVVVPESAISSWKGFGDGGDRDGPTGLTDYDRARAVHGKAGVIGVNESNAQALVLRNKPTACYLTEHRLFVHWVAADSEHDLIAAAETVLADTTSTWEPCGIWEVDGPALLMDSFVPGWSLRAENASYRGMAQPALVHISPGRWAIRSGQWTVSVNPDEPTTVALVQLLGNP
jgi:hypothetical protein